MSFVWAWTSRILRNKVRSLEETDIWRLYHLLHFYKAPMGEGGLVLQTSDGPGSKVKGTLPDQKASLEEQYQFIQSEVNNQVVSMLRVLQQLKGERIAGLKVNAKEQIAGVDSIVHLIPLESSPSANTIPGVAVREGHVSAGSVVCFYPGEVYVPSQVHKIPGYPHISSNNPYLMSRTDGSIINAKDYNHQTEGNPLAVGHLIRHPPKGQESNLMPFSFDIGADFPKELLFLVPNKYHRKPGFLFSDQRVVLRTLVFVATKLIENGNELLLNYRLHPDSDLPDWYTSVDSSEDRKRWS